MVHKNKNRHTLYQVILRKKCHLLNWQMTRKMKSITSTLNLSLNDPSKTSSALLMILENEKSNHEWLKYLEEGKGEVWKSCKKRRGGEPLFLGARTDCHTAINRESRWDHWSSRHTISCWYCYICTNIYELLKYNSTLFWLITKIVAS